jgi:hypothetical protein
MEGLYPSIPWREKKTMKRSFHFLKSIRS